MNKQITMGKWEVVCLLLNTINIQIFLNLPRYIVEIAGTAGWIMSIYISILIMLVFSVVLLVFKKFPGKDIVDIGQETAGKAGRVIVGLSFSILSFFAASLVLREFSENVKTIAFTTSPLSYVMVFFLIGMIIAAFWGFEVIIRLQGIFIPIVIVGYFIILLAVSPLIEIDNIFPILGSGLPEIFGEGTWKISLFIGISIIYWIPPFLKSFNKFKSASYWALGLSGFFILSSVFVFTTVLSYPTSTEILMPIYELSRLISLGRFFQRLEPIFLIIWSLSAFLYLSACFYCGIYGFRRAFNLPYISPLILPFAILAYNVAFLPPNVITVIELDRVILRTLGGIPSYGIPVLLLIIAWVRKKGGAVRNRTEN